MRIFGLIGYPLGHSFSSAFFNEKFRREGYNAIYKNFEISSLSELSSILELNRDIEGLNVTIPYKREIIKYLDKLDPLADKIGAVNVVGIQRDKRGLKMSGYNTDIVGFTESLKPVLKPSVKRALVLGTGGSSLAVRKGLSILGIEFKTVSRDHDRGDFVYKDINSDIIRSNPLIINTTPLGMLPEISSLPAIPYEYLTEDNILYDLVYNPGQTAFLSKGKDRGCTVIGGMEMLRIQAENAWDIWNRQY